MLSPLFSFFIYSSRYTFVRSVPFLLSKVRLSAQPVTPGTAKVIRNIVNVIRSTKKCYPEYRENVIRSTEKMLSGVQKKCYPEYSKKVIRGAVIVILGTVKGLPLFVLIPRYRFSFWLMYGFSGIIEVV